jgi:hypothetical protein
MKTLLIFSTETKDIEQWTNLPFIPRINEWFNLRDILLPREIESIRQLAHSWSGIKGAVQTVEYRHDDNDFYAEVLIRCED